jgi:hypothetical protein
VLEENTHWASAGELTVEQIVRLGIHEFIGQPDDAFHAAAMRVMGKNTELYGHLS